MGISEQIIPAAAVVAGSVLTIAGQALVGRGQRKHERRTKHWQEKRDAYADFRSCASRLRKRRVELARIQGQLDESGAALDAIVRKGPLLFALNGLLSFGLNSIEIAHIVRRAKRQHVEIGNNLAEIDAQAVEVQRVMEHALSVIDFTASTRVRVAVARLATVADSPEPDEAEFWKADQEYVEAVRQELKGWV